MLEKINDFIATTLIDNEISEVWKYAFRGSALPICPRQLMLGSFHKIEKQIPFSERYHFHVGRAIHSLCQETWAQQGLLWGSWVCSAKDCGVKFTNTRLEGGCCLRCGSLANYSEVLLTDATTGFSGHCDCPVYCPDLDAYLIFELKSRNSNIVSAAKEPYESDIYQVSAYATLLARRYWLRIAGRVVLWLGKPRPKPYKVWFYPGLGEELYEQQARLKLDLDQKIREGRVLEVEGRCTTPEDADGCPFAGICLSPVRDRLIIKDYEEYKLGKGF